jgi:hypothetical protein
VVYVALEHFWDHPNELSQFAVFYDLQVISYEYNDILFAVFYSVFADTKL